MQTLTRIAHLLWKILLLESAVLIFATIFWSWTGWHLTTEYATAIAATGGIIILLGLLAISARGSSDDMMIRGARRNLRGSNSQVQDSSTSPYQESTRIWFWLIGLGILTVATGMLLTLFF